MKFCKWCGKPVGPDDLFCMACGGTLVSGTPSAAPAPNVPQNATPAPVAAPPPAEFCRACGTQAMPRNNFCNGCGAPLGNRAWPSAAPFAGAQIPPQPFAPAPPIAAQAPRRHTRIWIGVFAAIAIIIVIAVVLNSGPKPEDSLDQARAAYLQHDQANFDKYVDVNNVLSDWTDQALNVWLKQQNAGAIETAAAQVVAAAVKSAYLPQVSQTVDQLVVSGTLPDQSQSGDNDQTTAFLTGFLSSVVHTLASSQLTYEGVESKTVSGDNASLNIEVGSSVSDHPLTVRINMQRDGDHWRVVAIPDLAGLMGQLNTASSR